jgi:hypothetical protein
MNNLESQAPDQYVDFLEAVVAIHNGVLGMYLVVMPSSPPTEGIGLFPGAKHPEMLFGLEHTTRVVLRHSNDSWLDHAELVRKRSATRRKSEHVCSFRTQLDPLCQFCSSQTFAAPLNSK